MTVGSTSADAVVAGHAVENPNKSRGGQVSGIRYSDPGYVSTPTGETVMAGLAFAQGRPPSMTVIVGPPGTGKTQAAVKYCKDHDDFSSNTRAIYVQASQWAKSPAAIFEEIAEKIGRYPHAFRLSALAKFILEYLGPGSLICIDEAQNLTPDSLDGLRYFLDQGGIGVVYVGNELITSRIFGKGRRAMYSQLSSRVGMRINLPGPTDGDINAMLDAWGVTGKDERSLARELGRMPGGLRALSQVIRHAHSARAAMPNASSIQLMRAAANIMGIVD